MEYTKLDDTTLQISTSETVTNAQTYTVDDLHKQLADASQAAIDYVNNKNVEIAEIQAKIDKCTELGIKTKQQAFQALQKKTA